MRGSLQKRITGVGGRAGATPPDPPCWLRCQCRPCRRPALPSAGVPSRDTQGPGSAQGTFK
eukprot:scaffold3614_cov123-Isochrysis_galbana.AAC.10